MKGTHFRRHSLLLYSVFAVTDMISKAPPQLVSASRASVDISFATWPCEYRLPAPYTVEPYRGLAKVSNR